MINPTKSAHEKCPGRSATVPRAAALRALGSRRCRAPAAPAAARRARRQADPAGRAADHRGHPVAPDPAEVVGDGGWEGCKMWKGWENV